MKRSYLTDLSDAEWQCLKAHIAAQNKHGRPRIHGSRKILDAIFYVLKSGCPWRLLPYDFPPWETVYWWFIAVCNDIDPLPLCPMDVALRTISTFPVSPSKAWFAEVGQLQ